VTFSQTVFLQTAGNF